MPTPTSLARNKNRDTGISDPGNPAPSQPTAPVASALNYDSDQITVANGQTAYDVKVTGGLFDKVKRADYVSIRTDVLITIKLNDTDNDPIEIRAADSPFIINSGGLALGVTNIFVANAAGGDATIDIELS